MQIVEPPKNNQRADSLAMFAAFSLLLTIVMLFYGPDIQQSNRDLLLVVLGALIGIVKDVYSFEFGSSKGSERNSQALADSVKQNANGK